MHSGDHDDQPAGRPGRGQPRVDPASLGDDALGAHLVALEAERARLDAEVLAAVGEWDRRRAWVADAAVSGACWLAPRTHASGRTARDKVKAARFLVHAPRVAAALDAAAISYEKVRLLARHHRPETAEAFARDEALLIEQAKAHRVEVLARILRHWDALADPDRYARDQARAERDRHVFLAETLDGTGALAGTLTPEGLALLDAELDRIAEALRHDERPDDPAAVVRSAGQRRHDALVEMARRSAAYDDEAGRRAPHHATVVLDHHTLTDDAAPVASRPQDATVAKAVALRWACSALLCRALIGPDSEVLDLGRTRRLFTAAQRKAILLQHGGCCFPGCDRPPGWCDIHHLDEWLRDDGPTTTRNGIPLCGHHHHAIHDRGFRVHRNHAGTLTFTRPNGTPIEV